MTVQQFLQLDAFDFYGDEIVTIYDARSKFELASYEPYEDMEEQDEVIEGYLDACLAEYGDCVLASRGIRLWDEGYEQDIHHIDLYVVVA